MWFVGGMVVFCWWPVGCVGVAGAICVMYCVGVRGVMGINAVIVIIGVCVVRVVRVASVGWCCQWSLCGVVCVLAVSWVLMQLL